MTRALVFDCDGVLADTELDGHLPAFNATFAQFGIPVIWNVDEYRELTKIGGGKERMRTLFDDPEVVRAAGLPTDPAKQDELLSTWHACKTVKFTEAIAQGQVTPRPGIRRVVEAAAEAGWRLSVASTSAADAVRAVLISAVGTDLAATFDPVLAGDVVAHKKPAPDIYLLAREVLGLAAEDILVIEDSGVGSQAAHAEVDSWLSRCRRLPATTTSRRPRSLSVASATQPVCMRRYCSRLLVTSQRMSSRSTTLSAALAGGSDMTQPVGIGIDVGSQGVRVLAATADGTVLDSVRVGWTLQRDPEGAHEQYPDVWWAEALGLLRQVCAGLPEQDRAAISGISVTATSGTVVVTDENLRPLRPAMMWWTDKRPVVEAEECAVAGADLCAELGYRFRPTFSLPKNSVD